MNAAPFVFSCASVLLAQEPRASTVDAGAPPTTALDARGFISKFGLALGIVGSIVVASIRIELAIAHADKDTRASIVYAVQDYMAGKESAPSHDVMRIIRGEDPIA